MRTTTTPLVADVDLVERQRRIEAKLDALVAKVDRLIAKVQPAAGLNRRDVDRLERMLPVVAATFGAELFTSHDCSTSAAPGLRLVTRGLSTKQLGKLFRRGEGHPVAGYLIQRHGNEFGAILWRVLAC